MLLKIIENLQLNTDQNKQRQTDEVKKKTKPDKSGLYKEFVYDFWTLPLSPNSSLIRISTANSFANMIVYSNLFNERDEDKTYSQIQIPISLLIELAKST